MMDAMYLWVAELGVQFIHPLSVVVEIALKFCGLIIIFLLFLELTVNRKVEIFLKVLIGITAALGSALSIVTLIFSPSLSMERGLKYIKAGGKYASEINLCIDEYLSGKRTSDRYPVCVYMKVEMRNDADAAVANKASEDALRRQIADKRAIILNEKGRQ